jgi:hypothetical protein
MPSTPTHKTNEAIQRGNIETGSDTGTGAGVSADSAK